MALSARPYYNKADETCRAQYCLYDMDGDGIDELLVIEGTCEADYNLSIYTWDNGLLRIYDGGEGSAGECGFIKGQDCIYRDLYHMGYQKIDKLVKDGNTINENTIYEHESQDGSDDGEFKELKGAPLEFFDCTDVDS